MDGDVVVGDAAAEGVVQRRGDDEGDDRQRGDRRGQARAGEERDDEHRHAKREADVGEGAALGVDEQRDEQRVRDGEGRQVQRAARVERVDQQDDRIGGDRDEQRVGERQVGAAVRVLERLRRQQQRQEGDPDDCGDPGVSVSFLQPPEEAHHVSRPCRNAAATIEARSVTSSLL
jgi:hypothetical protein